MAAPREQPPLCKFVLYSTKSRFFLLGRTKDRQQWRVLKFARDANDARELDVVEDPLTYSEREIAALLSSVHDGNLQHGGLKFEVQARVPGRPPVACGCSVQADLIIPFCVRLLTPRGACAGRRSGRLLRASGGLLPAAGDQEAAAWQRVRCGAPMTACRH